MRRILFVDRDGTLIEEPEDFQIDSYEKFRLVPGVIGALTTLQDAGYELVMVTNQDGLGTPSFPRARFEGPHGLLMQILASQGLEFREVLIDESFEEQRAATRKPGVGLLLHYLRDRSIDLAGSAVIGDRETDLELARNLGCRGFRIGPELGWGEVIRALTGDTRRAELVRETRETRVAVSVDLDRRAEPSIRTGLGFFDHMLEQLGKHGGFALTVHCDGDLGIDEHHTIEDTGLAVGQALKQAIGDKRGIGRYGSAASDADDVLSARFVLPMDETLASAALDFSGRACLVFDGSFPRDRVGDMPTELVPHFFRSLCDSAGLNLNLQVRGENAHHMVEACFKATGRALRQVIARDGFALPTTKGVL